MCGMMNALRNGVVSAVWFLLAACSAPVSIVKPLDVSQANQSASTQFMVRKSGDYRIALLFAKGHGLTEINKQIEVWGDLDNEGVAIPIHLRILKDGQVYFDEVLVTAGVQWGQGIDYEGRYVNAAVRLIKILELVPGSYFVEVNTLDKLDAFRSIEGFVSFSYYNPKH
ncbi:DUF5625 family protein [Pseudomonas sp. MDT1-16]|uniref:DUF5625 family protein n=1 Tax=Pseudomonas sp. AL03 TaxID=3042230 RepID=UPI00249B9135|nr:DUF5625 family protein [Pseudomonas sp. AL03]MDI3273763.1 DUF5625 family protein [Pseudomonas sp. AL03]